MAFYKARFQKTSQKWYPHAVVVGKSISTKELAQALSDRSTVTLSDCRAVLSEIGLVMAEYMAQGKSVKLEGLGSFRYGICSAKNGVETEEKVSASQISAIRVRFVPETSRNADGTVATRSCQPGAVEWLKLGVEEEEKKEETSDTPADEGGEDNGGDNTGGGGATGGNPL